MVLANDVNYSIHVKRTMGARQGKDIISFYFSVCESGKVYPNSYVCTLPKNYKDLLEDCHSVKSKSPSFLTVFADIDRVKFTVDLLKESLTYQNYAENTEIKSEIENRIALLNRQILTASRKCKGYFKPWIGIIRS